MFTKAIVRTPCKNMIKGITSADLGLPYYTRALEQHKNYIMALEKCGLEVFILEADENYPDSTFIEDVALLTPSCAIIMNPGANSRKGEIDLVDKYLEYHFNRIEKILAPGTIEAGDIMMVGKHYYIGISQRTNEDGANQLISILSKYGMSGSKVILSEVLHLKTGLAYLENNNLAITGEFLNHQEFKQYNQIIIDADENYAANCVWINNTVIVPSGFSKSKAKIEQAGYKTLDINVSEFQKLDGGLSCLSLRF